MSGTGFGTVVLHVSPEAAVGGVFALVQTGDEMAARLHGILINLFYRINNLVRMFSTGLIKKALKKFK